EAVELQPRQRLAGVGPVAGLPPAEELSARPLPADPGADGAGAPPAVVVAGAGDAARALRLALPVGAGHLHAAGAERARVAARPPRAVLHRDAMVDHGDLAGDDRRGRIEVDVVPLQAEDLAAA